MEDGYHKSGLYRWQKQTKPRVYSRSQKVATTDDIQDWLQKVEQASNKAAAAVLETEGVSPYYAGRQRGRETVKGLADHARIENEAYTEAQDLLQEWLSQKVTLCDDDLGDDPDLRENDPWRKEELGSKARREWDNLLEGNLEELGIDATPRVRQAQQETDPYANLYDLDDEEAVSKVMRNMLDKNLIKETFRTDLGFDDDSKAHDPRLKMALRHQRVKENREKREEELKRRRREAESKKQARLTAQQMVMKEEKQKEMKKKQEEQEMRQQMAQIRKEMQEARGKEAEERLRLQQAEEEKARLAQEELQRQEDAEREEMQRRRQEASQRRQAQLAQQQMLKAKQAANNLRIQHRHFTAWYDVVLSRRLAFGKARALADWRLTLRVWNAWRSYVRSQRITIETKQHEQNVVEESRKAAMARKHHHLSQLRRYFSAWRDFVAQEQDKKALERAQETTRSKMMNLLTAVADGSLWSAREEDGGKKEEGRPRGRGGSARDAGKERSGSGSRSGQSGAHNVRSELDQMFNQPPRRIAWDENSDISTSPSLSSRPASSLSSASATRLGSRGERMPTEGWQITRKHAQLSKEELARLIQMGGSDQEGSEVHAEHSDVKIRRRFGTQPWMNRHYTVNNFEHRFTAQQKLLRDQQAEIKEHKRMIQEMMFARHQQELREGIVTQPSPDSQSSHNAVVSTASHPAQDGDGSEGKAGKSQAGPSSSSSSQRATKSSSLPQGRDGGGGEGKAGGGGQGSNSVSAVQRPAKSANTQQRLGDGGDSHRSGSSSARSGHSGSEVTTTSAATSAAQSNSKYLQVLKNMEERAAERARLKAERDEKRRKAEEERLAQLKAEEEELKRRAEEEKQARVQAYREKKRLEKQRELERQKELEVQKELTAKADRHYQRALMKFRVLLPMKRLVQMAQEQIEKAERHHNHQILRRVVKAWKSYTDELTSEKKQLADDLHGYIVVRRCFHSWKNFKYRMIFLERRAERHYRELMLPKLFEAWQQSTAEEKLVEQERLRVAQEFYPMSLQRKVFHAWRRLPQELRREAEREKLRTEMRKKVADLLPDFKPSVSITQSTDSTT